MNPFDPDIDAEPIAEGRRIALTLLDRVGLDDVAVAVRRGGNPNVRGRACRLTRRIEVQVGACDYACLVETVIHEVVHLLASPEPDAPHPRAFWSRLVDVAAEIYGVRVPAVVRGDEHWQFACDWRIEEALLRRHRWASTVVPGFEGSPRAALLAHAAEVCRREDAEIAPDDAERICFGTPRTNLVVPLRRDDHIVAFWRFRMPRVLETIPHSAGADLIAAMFQTGRAA